MEVETRVKQLTSGIRKVSNPQKRVEQNKKCANGGIKRKKDPADVEYMLPVSVSHITKYGFRVHAKGRVYYVSRAAYPWFGDATDEEIRDVVLMWECELKWQTLDVCFELKGLRHPERSVLFRRMVRGVLRPDLFDWDKLGKARGITIVDGERVSKTYKRTRQGNHEIEQKQDKTTTK